MLPRVEFADLKELHKGVEVTQKMLVNIRGCNGSGKSTIPLAMMESDPNVFEVVWLVGGKERVLATVFPEYQFAALGKYTNKCGGMDSMKTTDEIRLAVEVLWTMNYNILMEGIMASTVRQTYIDLFTRLNQEYELKRQIIVYNILPPLEVCLQRIQQRNGGKPIKEDLVLSKWKTVENNVQHFKNAGFTSLRVSNDKITKNETLDWFFSQIDSENDEEQVAEVDGEGELPVVPKDELKGYEWYKWYKEPNDSVIFNEKYRDRFWWFLHERLNVYHKRVILQQPYPWTDDKILNTYRFTNICRDMDRLSIYERDHILVKLDEPVADRETRKKSVMFNIMLFRTFVKVDTYECFGFIDFSDKAWEKQWEKGKKALLDKQSRGIQSFTGSFMMHNLKQCNPDPETNTNKTINAICMCQNFIDHLEEIYEKTVSKCKGMKEQIQFLLTLPGVGSFTAYEYACSFAMPSRYCKNRLVPWTQDNYTNLGPGSTGGLEWIFKSLGNLSEIEAIIYLRSIWQLEMKRLGYYDEFIQQLPPELDNDLDLRIIEHCLCETHKYNKVATSIGRPKERFEIRTTDVSTLIL